MDRSFSRSTIVGLLILTSLFVCSCRRQGDTKTKGLYKKGGFKMDVQKEIFGKLSDGRQVELYTLTNANGARARIMTYGGILVSLEVPDRLRIVAVGVVNLTEVVEKGGNLHTIAQLFEYG